MRFLGLGRKDAREANAQSADLVQATIELFRQIADERVALFERAKGDSLDRVEAAWIHTGAWFAAAVTPHLTPQLVNRETATALASLFARPMVSYWYWYADKSVKMPENERLETCTFAFQNILVAFGDYGAGVPPRVTNMTEELAEALGMDDQFRAERRAEDSGVDASKLNVYDGILAEKTGAITHGHATPSFASFGLPIMTTLDFSKRREELNVDFISEMIPLPAGTLFAVRLARGAAFRHMMRAQSAT